MFGDLAGEDLDGALEAMLFVTDEPVDVITLADILELDAQTVQQALERISRKRADSDAGVLLREAAGGWRLQTHPRYHDLLERYILSWDTRRLSQAALETLAIVAYGQPITRQGVAAIRGVNSDSSINSLIEKGLLRESGQVDSPGYPMTYSTTGVFLEKFGLMSVKDLPPIDDFAPDDETARILRRSLSGNAHMALRQEEGESGGIPYAGQVIHPEGDFDGDIRESMRAALADALAQSAGVVEKIDFDSIEFEE